MRNENDTQVHIASHPGPGSMIHVKQLNGDLLAVPLLNDGLTVGDVLDQLRAFLPLENPRDALFLIDPSTINKHSSLSCNERARSDVEYLLLIRPFREVLTAVATDLAHFELNVEPCDRDTELKRTMKLLESVFQDAKVLPVVEEDNPPNEDVDEWVERLEVKWHDSVQTLFEMMWGMHPFMNDPCNEEERRGRELKICDEVVHHYQLTVGLRHAHSRQNSELLRRARIYFQDQ